MKSRCARWSPTAGRMTRIASARITVIVKESRSEAVYVIQDDGLGFNPSILPDPTDPTPLEKDERPRAPPHPHLHGRGLL